MAREGVERRLAAILSADVVGYSRLMAEDGPATIRTLISYRKEIQGLVGDPYSAENRSASPGDGVELPALAERSLSVAISGADVRSGLAKRKSGGPKMYRGPFASVWIVALVGDGPRVLFQAASR